MKKLFYLLFTLTTLISCTLDKVDTGSAPGAGDGEILYTAFNKVNVVIDTVQYLLLITDTVDKDVDTLKLVKIDSIYNENTGTWLTNLDTIDIITSFTSPIDTLTITDSLSVGLIRSEDTIKLRSNNYDIIFNLDSFVGNLVNARFNKIISSSLISDTSIISGDTTTGGVSFNTAMQDIDSIDINNLGVFGLPAYSSNPTTTREGFIYYNNTVDSCRYWNGSEWRNF